MLRRKLLFFEHALCLYLLAQTLFPSHFTLSSILLGFTVLSFLKYRFEGIRIAYCILTAIQFLSILLNFTYIRIALTITGFVTIYYFPMYKYPVPTGKYLVGYKMLNMENPKGKNVNVAMYYPTHEKTRDANYSTVNGPWIRFADGMSVLADLGNKPSISRLFVRTMYNFLGRLKLGVNENAKITRIEQFEQGFPCIIFSHGLAMNMHIYNVLLKEWASNGFIVFTVDHDEEIFRKLSTFSSWDEYNKWRNSQLIARKQTVSKLLDIVYNPTELHRMTDDTAITLNYDKIFLAGHSFGGGNAGELAAEDKRVTGGVVLLDPSFNWCDQEILHKPINKPVLCLRSNQYENGPTYPNPSRTYARNCNENRENTVSGYFKGTMHHCTSDLMLFISRELAFLGEPLIKEKEIENQILSNVWLTRIFLEAAMGKSENVNGRQGEIEGVKWGVVERFGEKMNEMGRKNVFIVDR